MTTVRYFASTTGDIGNVAFQYLRSMLFSFRVRLLSLPPATLEGVWRACYPLFATPLPSPYVNVVCCPPAFWVREQRVSMPILDKDGNLTGMEPAVGTAELYTSGVRNVLIATTVPPAGPARTTALRYEAIVVPTLELGAEWQRAGAKPTVIPVPVLDHHVLRNAIAPVEDHDG